MVQPAIPARRHFRGFGVAIVNHIPALAAFDGRLALLVIFVALVVLADEAGPTADVEPSANRGAVPPSEYRFEHQDSGRPLRARSIADQTPPINPAWAARIWRPRRGRSSAGKCRKMRQIPVCKECRSTPVCGRF